ncbi:hypothetical protein ACMDCT_15820 [Halomonadaceae bacterium KBTZ08]
MSYIILITCYAQLRVISDTTNVVPSTFEVFYMIDLAGRFAGNKVFIDELEAAVPRFYEQVG